MLPRILLSLVAWLVLGFAFTEMTVLTVNAWVVHQSQRHDHVSMAAQERLSARN